MWDHGAPALFRWLLAAYAGYTVTRALFRWVATVRVLGIRRTLSGAQRMSSVRYKQIWTSEQGAASWLPIRPSVPVLFELQVFAYVVLVSWLATRRGSTALAFFDSAILLPAGVLALAHASESILPPCILYLGVSEPGQLKPFQFLAGSRNVLTVSALDQENLDVAAGEAAATGALSGLLVPDWIGRLPLAALVPRRRLESIRVRDDAWEGVVRQMIEFAPLAVIDLRSWSAIITKELGWYLQAPRAGGAVLLTREDGGTSLDAELGDTARELRVKVSELPRLVDELQRRRFQPPSSRAWPAELARRLEAETRIKQDLLAELAVAEGPVPDLDAKLLRWAFGAEARASLDSVTGSIAAAVALMRRRIPVFSYSIHVGGDGTAWADIGVQPIPKSFRVSDSGRHEVDHPAKALVMSLLRGELGLARGISSDPSRIRLLRKESDHRASVGDEPVRRRLWELLCDLRANDGTPDAALETRLAAWCGVARTSNLEDLDPAIRAVLSLGEYSMAVYVTVDGLAWAEVAARPRARWLVAFSFDPPRLEEMRPAQALLAAALKAELQLFDGMVSQR
jgi:hypothetical protein